MTSLRGKTLFITGGSRGIGHAIAVRAAKDGANVAIAAKTATPHPKLPGTVYTAAEDIERAGGKALPLVVDVRDETQIQDAIAKTVETFGGLDILVNNASAISLTDTPSTPMKRFDLMFGVNVRATFAASQAAIPHLRKAANPHILNMAPPLVMVPKWFQSHVAYTMSKYGMSMCVLGMAAELTDEGIAVNALWPRTTIATAAVEFAISAELMDTSRKPEIMADAAQKILIRPARETTGNFFIDEDFLRTTGVTDFEPYAMKPGATLTPDFFLPD